MPATNRFWQLSYADDRMKVNFMSAYAVNNEHARRKVEFKVPIQSDDPNKFALSNLRFHKVFRGHQEAAHLTE